MSDAREFDDVVRDKIEDLKQIARAVLRREARALAAPSDVIQSALLSVLDHAALQQIALAEVDEEGHPALWPLLVSYVERHCRKWNKRWQRQVQRMGRKVPLDAGDESRRPIDPAARGPSPEEETEIKDALEALDRKLTPRQRQVAALSAEGMSLEQIAAKLGCSESTVSNEKKAIRTLLAVG
jgi:RNA polymerase sigma factor (sigma-70 family)